MILFVCRISALKVSTYDDDPGSKMLKTRISIYCAHLHSIFVCPSMFCRFLSFFFLWLNLSALTEFLLLCVHNLPLQSLDWGSVQCSCVIRLLIQMRQKGSMSWAVAPLQQSITNPASWGITKSQQLPHAASSVQTITSHLRHSWFLCISIEISSTLPCLD